MMSGEIRRSPNWRFIIVLASIMSALAVAFYLVFGAGVLNHPQDSPGGMTLLYISSGAFIAGYGIMSWFFGPDPSLYLVHEALSICPDCTSPLHSVGDPETQCWKCHTVWDKWTGEMLGGFSRDDQL